MKAFHAEHKQNRFKLCHQKLKAFEESNVILRKKLTQFSTLEVLETL